MPADRASICARCGQADRPANRTHSLHSRAARYRGSQAGAGKIQEQGSPRFRPGHVRDHTEVNKQALALVGKLKVKPEDNGTSRGLTKQAAAKRDELAKLNGAAFDKAYVANEVAYHKTVNGALESTLIPSASNGELKGLLQTGLKIFQ